MPAEQLFPSSYEIRACISQGSLFPRYLLPLALLLIISDKLRDCKELGVEFCKMEDLVEKKKKHKQQTRGFPHLCANLGLDL